METHTNFPSKFHILMPSQNIYAAGTAILCAPTKSSTAAAHKKEIICIKKAAAAAKQQILKQKPNENDYTLLYIFLERIIIFGCKHLNSGSLA